MTSPPRAPSAPTDDLVQHGIVFFDGVCALCSHLVRLLLRCDKKHELRFAPLQGETAAAMLVSPVDDPGEWSVVYVDAAGIHTRSDAALRICRRIGGLLGCLAWLRVIPRPLRDAVYRAVARRRYRWFGRHAVCPVPPADVRARFLP